MRFVSRFIAVCLVGAVTFHVLAAQERPGNGVSLPIPIKQVKADYTPEARTARIEGTVRLSCVVLANGHVGDVTVVQSLDADLGLDRQAVDALKQWEFKPGTKDGKAVDVRIEVEMTFTLK